MNAKSFVINCQTEHKEGFIIQLIKKAALPFQSAVGYRKHTV